MAVTTPDAVPGEVIEAAWGDAVRADLLNHETAIAAKLPLSGGTISGNLITTGYVRTGDLPTTPLPGFQANADGGMFDTKFAIGANITLLRSGAANATTERFLRFNATASQIEIGSVSIASGSSVAFNTTSDPRLKERTGDAADAADIVAALGAQVYRGRWIADQGAGREWVFVNSTDVEAVAPFAVQGAADAFDDNGEIIAQQVDQSALVPLLLAALSQALARIEALEAR